MNGHVKCPNRDSPDIMLSCSVQMPRCELHPPTLMRMELEMTVEPYARMHFIPTGSNGRDYAVFLCRIINHCHFNPCFNIFSGKKVTI